MTSAGPIVVPLKKTALMVHNFCQELSNSMYRDELFNLAVELKLPVTNKTTKRELCDQISKLLVREYPKGPTKDSDSNSNVYDLSDSLRERIDIFRDEYGPEPPKDWYNLLYGPELDIVGLPQNNDWDRAYYPWRYLPEGASSEEEYNSEEEYDSDYGHDDNKRDWDRLLQIISAFPEKDVKRLIKQKTENMDEEQYGDDKEDTDRIFTEEDREEILNLHKAIVNGVLNLREPIISYLLR